MFMLDVIFAMRRKEGVGKAATCPDFVEERLTNWDLTFLHSQRLTFRDES